MTTDCLRTPIPVEKGRSRLAGPQPAPPIPRGAFPGPAAILFIRARPTTLGELSFLEDSEPRS